MNAETNCSHVEDDNCLPGKMRNTAQEHLCERVLVVPGQIHVTVWYYMVD